MKESKIGLGLAAIGRPEYINIRQEEDPDKSFSVYRENAFRMLDHAYSKGIRHFDVAASYGKGEQFLLDWYRERGYTDVILSSKWGYTYKANWEIGYRGAHEIKEHSLSKLREQWSFARNLLPGLRTYQIHSATFDSGVLNNEEILEELNRIKNETKMRIGLSVSGPDQKEVLVAAAQVEVGGKPLFESYQATYNILDASTFKTLKSLGEQGMQIIIKEALANGRILENRSHPHYDSLYKRLAELSEAHGVTTDAIALRFVIDSLYPDLVLSGASTVEQLESNLLARSFRLSSEELDSLNEFQVEPDFYWTERKQLEWN